MAFFLAISILLNILCIFAIVVLFLRQNRLQEVERKQEQTLREMEDLFSSFIYEMKDENEKLHALLQHPSNQMNEKDQPVIKTQSVEIVRGTEEDLPEKETSHPVEPTVKTGVQHHLAKRAYGEKSKMQDSEELPPWLTLDEEVQKEDVEATPKTVQEQIVELWNEGKSIEAIAKKVDKGKTEVELTLKFYGIR
ncbi:swarming motility protein SwrB [Bacillus carboniphilus]|uniref:Swarming motility protein SwrB n=1 Tax=Bacillus carboniphilus TaxID=86663 RepID=A0ABN0WBT5_9BACI